MTRAEIEIRQAEGYPKNYVWLTATYTGPRGTSRMKYLGEFKIRQGIAAFYDYSSGNRRMLYSNIDGTGSLSGMRKNYGWKDDIVLRAHGCLVNIDRWSVTNYIDAILYLFEKRWQKNIDRLMDKRFVVSYNHSEVVLEEEGELVL